MARQAFLLSRGVEWPGGKPTIFPSEEEERVSHARTAGPFHAHQKGMQTILYGTVLYFPEKLLEGVYMLDRNRKVYHCLLMLCITIYVY